MEDLEATLGETEVEYMEIRVAYRHSGSSVLTSIRGTSTGVSSLRTRVETVAAASVKVHNTISPWSLSLSSTTKPLLPIIERHWGPERAKEAVRQIVTLPADLQDPTQNIRATSSSQEEMGPQGSGRILSTSRNALPPAVPLRRASLQRVRQMTATKTSRRRARALLANDSSIWTSLEPMAGGELSLPLRNAEANHQSGLNAGTNHPGGEGFQFLAE